MDKYIYIGKIINTFGIKGELKIVSDFLYKDRVFIKDFKIYIGTKKELEVINNHRTHQNFDLITLNNYDNINNVLKYKGLDVFIDRDDLGLNNNEYLLEDLLGYKVYDDSVYLGDVIDIEFSKNCYLFKVRNKNKTFYIPNIDIYIKNVDKDKMIINTNRGRDLII